MKLKQIREILRRLFGTRYQALYKIDAPTADKHKYTLFLCTKHNKEFVAEPHLMFARRDFCIECNREDGLAISDSMYPADIWTRKLAIIHPNFEVLGKYDGVMRPLLHRCKLCKHEWSPTPNNLQKARHQCPNCVNAGWSRTPEQEEAAVNLKRNWQGLMNSMRAKEKKKADKRLALVAKEQNEKVKQIKKDIKEEEMQAGDAPVIGRLKKKKVKIYDTVKQKKVSFVMPELELIPKAHPVKKVVAEPVEEIVRKNKPTPVFRSSKPVKQRKPLDITSLIEVGTKPAAPVAVPVRKSVKDDDDEVVLMDESDTFTLEDEEDDGAYVRPRKIAEAFTSHVALCPGCVELSKQPWNVESCRVCGKKRK